jgi:phenylacetate-CoA ligase/benzoylacetate-CoA ligase
MADVYDEIETRPWEEVLALHERRLRDQVEYLASESAYYRDRFDEWDVDPADVRTLDDLADVPFTTKDDERRSQAGASADRPLGAHQAAPTADVNLTLSSSGTTGEPTYFGFTERDREVLTEMVARASYATGVRPDDTIVHAIGRPIVPGGLPYIEAYGEIGANVVPAGGADTEGLVRILADVRPELIHSTPSHLRYLVERTPELTDHEVAEFGVETLIGGGEPGIAEPEIRAGLREAWEADGVREVMGLGDVGPAVAGECPAEDGAHFIGQGHLHFELIDPGTGEPLPIEAGAEGELVYTPLVREATPLLRFRSGDYARVVATDCSCGRTSPRLQVIGRTDDMLIYKAQNVYPTAIRDVVGGVPGARNRMKVVLPDADTYHFEEPIPIRVVRDGAVDRPAADVVADVEAAVRDRLRVRVDATLVDADEVDLSKYKADLLTVE